MMNDYNYITCPKCGHDRNASTLKKCEICGQKLGKGFSLLPLVWVGILLMTLAAGYFLLKNLLWKPTPSNLTAVTSSPSPTPETSPLSPSTTTQSSPLNPSPTTQPSSLQTSPSTIGKFDLISAANPDLYQSIAQIPNVSTLR